MRLQYPARKTYRHPINRAAHSHLLARILPLLLSIGATSSSSSSSPPCPADSELLGKDEHGEDVCGCTQSAKVGSSSGGTLCVGPKGECRWGRRSDAVGMWPREPHNKQEKKQYWNDLKMLPWQEKISPATPSLWPSREKVEGFHPTCPDCKCASSCNNIVFIIGCGHSGTTYMTRLLGAHPKYHSIMQETGWFSAMMGTGAAYERFRQESVNCGRNGKVVLVEKTARHILYLKRILQLFPGTAKILMMVRDGRDVTYSVAKRYNRTGDLLQPCTESVRWTLDNNAARPYFKKKKMFKRVRYEDLVANPKETMDDVFQFLEGEPAPPDVLAQFDSAASLKWGNVKAQAGEVPPPVSTGGLVNKHYRNWQMNQPLFDGRGQWSKGEAAFSNDQLKLLYSCPRFADMMVMMGYLDVANESMWYDRSRVPGADLPLPPPRETD